MMESMQQLEYNYIEDGVNAASRVSLHQGWCQCSKYSIITSRMVSVQQVEYHDIKDGVNAATRVSLHQGGCQCSN